MRVNVRVLGRDVGFFIVGYGDRDRHGLPPGRAELAEVGRRRGADRDLRGLRAPALHRCARAGRSGGSSNQLHATRLPGMAGPHTLDIDILPGSATAGRSSGAPAADADHRQPGRGGAGADHRRARRSSSAPSSTCRRRSASTRRSWRSSSRRSRPSCPRSSTASCGCATAKDTLAMGNITGAMVFQSCLPTVLGLLFTTWTFTAESRDQLRVGGRRDRGHDPDLREHAADAAASRPGRCSSAGRSTSSTSTWPSSPRSGWSARRPLIPQHHGAERASEGRARVYFLRLSRRP